MPIATGCAGTRMATYEARVRVAINRAIAISGLTKETFRHELSQCGLDEVTVQTTLEGGRQVGADFLLATAEVAGTTVGVLLEEAPLSELVADLTGRVRALEGGRKSLAP